VLTVTISPGANGVDGTKLPPSPSESPSTVPSCGPLEDPVTEIEPSCPADRPRKAIWVLGDANWLPGVGNTYTGGGPAGGLGFDGGLGLVFAPAGAATARHRAIASTIALAA
jgi:hypothetical protein